MSKTKKATFFNRDSSSNCVAMNEFDDKQNNQFTPEQILEHFPYAKHIGWTADQVRFLYERNLIKGQIDTATNQLHILSDSFAELLEFYKSQQED